jgi:hypothetical protein
MAQDYLGLPQTVSSGRMHRPREAFSQTVDCYAGSIDSGGPGCGLDDVMGLTTPERLVLPFARFENISVGRGVDAQ